MKTNKDVFIDFVFGKPQYKKGKKGVFIDGLSYEREK